MSTALEDYYNQKKKYTKSEKVLARDFDQTNWQRRLDVLILRNQGWSFRKIGEKYGVSAQAVTAMYNKIKNLTIEELEQNLKGLRKES